MNNVCSKSTLYCICELAYNYKFLSLGEDPVAIDGDDPQHITWILERANERASQYNISGVTYRLTQVENKYIRISYDEVFGFYLLYSQVIIL